MMFSYSILMFISIVVSWRRLLPGRLRFDLDSGTVELLLALPALLRALSLPPSLERQSRWFLDGRAAQKHASGLCLWGTKEQSRDILHGSNRWSAPWRVSKQEERCFYTCSQRGV